MKFRWAFSILLTLAGAASHGEETSITAVEKFKGIEALLARAGRFDFKAHVTSHGAIDSDVTAAVGVANASIVAIHLRGSLNGKAQDLRLRSDGIVTVVTKDGKNQQLQPGRFMREAIQVAFLRVGMLHNLVILSKGLQPEHDKGGIQTWVTVDHIQYSSTKRRGQTGLSFDVLIEGKKSGEATLWIDDRTKMPIRREQSLTVDGKKLDSIEEYSDFIPTA